MSGVVRRRFYWPLAFLCVFSSLASLTSIAQQRFSSAAEAALPDAPEPAQIPGSAPTDSNLAAAANITGTVLDSNHEALPGARVTRSEERRVGKECVRLCRSRWSPYH